jgi:hypothetical protein
MTDGNHEGAGGNIPPHMILSREAEVTHSADGTMRLSQMADVHGMTPDQVQEATAGLYGIRPDDVRVTPLNTPYAPDMSQQAARRRGSVAFSSDNWKSPWNPGGGADPNAE